MSGPVSIYLLDRLSIGFNHRRRGPRLGSSALSLLAFSSLLLIGTAEQPVSVRVIPMPEWFGSVAVLCTAQGLVAFGQDLPPGSKVTESEGRILSWALGQPAWAVSYSVPRGRVLPASVGSDGVLMALVLGGMGPKMIRSSDQGRTWEVIGSTPPEVFGSAFRDAGRGFAWSLDSI